MSYPFIDFAFKKPEQPDTQLENRLNKIGVQVLGFENHNNQKNVKNNSNYFPFNKITMHKKSEQRKKNLKMLPGIAIKNFKKQEKNPFESQHKANALPMRKPLRNSRNSEILNSLIDILKIDSGNNFTHSRNETHLKTQPPYKNQFLELREISSVKNSRGPKIITNQLMSFSNQGNKRRNLQSEGKNRQKLGKPTYSYSLTKNQKLKKEGQDEMEMTFYKPSTEKQEDKNKIYSEEDNEFNQFMLQ